MQDIEGTPVNLAILHLGIRVFHQLACASTFSWAKVRKMSFKRKKFLIKLHPEAYVSPLSPSPALWHSEQGAPPFALTHRLGIVFPALLQGHDRVPLRDAERGQGVLEEGRRAPHLLSVPPHTLLSCRALSQLKAIAN